ncbi:hypothetical protein O0L34_g6166 [Tuta absoluta]|nr:hypothetical protein O0L34_g6166 [Tuta absoluta]
MCCIFSCFAWALDIVQRAVTLVLACLMACFICIAVFAAMAAGAAYGYNYFMAEYLTFARDNTTLYLGGGKKVEVILNPEKATTRTTDGINRETKKINVTKSRKKDFKTIWNQSKEPTQYDKILPEVTSTPTPEVTEPATQSWPTRTAFTTPSVEQDVSRVFAPTEHSLEFSNLDHPSLPDLQSDTFDLNLRPTLPPGSFRVNLMPTLSDLPPSAIQLNLRPTIQNLPPDNSQLSHRPTMQGLKPGTYQLNQTPTLVDIFPGAFRLIPRPTFSYISSSAFPMNKRPITSNFPPGAIKYNTRPTLPEFPPGGMKYSAPYFMAPLLRPSSPKLLPSGMKYVTRPSSPELSHGAVRLSSTGLQPGVMKYYTRPILPGWQPGLTIKHSKTSILPTWPLLLYSTIDISEQRLRNEDPMKYRTTTKAHLEKDPFMYYKDYSSDDNEIYMYKPI